MKRILTIAGSDSGGGAGIQADLKVITVLGGFGTSVITALTAQNTLGVQGVHAVPTSFIRQQMDSVLTDIGADAAKTGMLASQEIVEVVSEGIRRHQLDPLVVDPVMVAKSGDSLLSKDARETIKKLLLPLAFVVTPNLPEAEVLCGFPVRNPEEMKTAAKKIHDFGPKNVLIKGGHLKGDAVDLLYDGQSFQTYETPRLNQRNTHGTGCSFSAALATFLGQELEIHEAVGRAKAFITVAIRTGISVGSGHGPTNPYSYIAVKLEREDILKDLKRALERLAELKAGKIIPECRSNLVYAGSNASSYDDVAGVPGRITNVGRSNRCLPGTGFRGDPPCGQGGSRGDVKSTGNAIGNEYSLQPSIIEACKQIDLRMASFDRSMEPKDIKEKEGSTWNGEHVRQ
jgi:hydroxymethylpyrimidine kinase/phosphomethylpyrimidine kinase